MAATDATTARTTEFELDRFEVEDGRLVVEGRWHGVLGRRFVRPVLRVSGRRRLIAVLEHKPWAADEAAPWVAAFAVDGPPGPARLEVAPDICVDLPAPGPGAGGRRVAARAARPAKIRGSEAGKAAVKQAAAQRADAAGAHEADAAGEREAPIEAARAEADAAAAREEAAAAAREEAVTSAREETVELRRALDAAREETELARRETDRARAETERMRERLAESSELVERLRAEQASTEAARGQALVEREQLRRELEDARRPSGRALATTPYLPTFREPARRAPSWGTRAGAFVALVVLLYALAWLISAVT